MLFISKSSASIVNSIVFGISILSLEIPKLSCNPGKHIAIAIFLLPLSIIFPFVIFTFLKLLSITVPATTINGVYIFSYFPFTFTVWTSLFVYVNVTLTFPLFPTISLASTSFPFNSYLTLHVIGSSLSIVPWYWMSFPFAFHTTFVPFCSNVSSPFVFSIFNSSEISFISSELSVFVILSLTTVE